MLFSGTLPACRFWTIVAEWARVCVEEEITGTVLKPPERRLRYGGDDC